jgi:hypothetical protein
VEEAREVKEVEEVKEKANTNIRHKTETHSSRSAG